MVWGHRLRITARFVAPEALQRAEELPKHRDIRHLSQLDPEEMPISRWLDDTRLDFTDMDLT